MSADPTKTGVATVFVKGLPENATSEELETVFQDIGPVRRAFVVTEKGSSKCRGFGYVQFSLQADVLRALKRPPQLRGRRLTVSPALPRRSPEDTEKEKAAGPEGEKGDVGEVLARRALARERKRKARTLVVAHAAGEEAAARAAIGSDGSIAGGTYLRPALLVTCPHPASAAALGARLGKSKSPRLHAALLPALPAARLVARNVPFTADAKALLALFSRFGFVLDLTLNAGVAFVQFMDVKDATRAQRRANGRELGGRPIAVDWAVAKSKYQSREEEQEQAVEGEDKEERGGLEGSGGSEGGSKSEEEDEQEDEEEDEQEDEEEDEEEGSGSEEAKASDEAKDGEEEEDEEEEEEEEEKEQKKPRREGSSDVGRGGTLFLKNLPFDVDEADVVRKFKRWGDVRFCNIVYDRETGLSRGTAFVTYKDPAHAAAALAELGSAGAGGGRVLSALATSALQFRGRPVTVLPAVERGAALKMREKAPPSDKRNLSLLHEGVLPRQHLEELGVPPAEIQLREQLLKNRKQKLKNPNFYISPTRLAIMNLPRTLEVPELRRVMTRVAAPPGKLNKLTQVKIMRDRNDLDQEGKPRSKGFAFVEFADKDQALAALRTLNNSTEFFGSRRPIVEFAVENGFITKAQEKKVAALKNNPDLKKVGTPGRKPKAGPLGPKMPQLAFSQPDAAQPNKKKQKQDKKAQKPKANPAQRNKQKPALEALLDKEDSKKRPNRTTNSAPKRQKQEERDDFDDLVAQYRNDASSQKKMKKWFT